MQIEAITIIRKRKLIRYFLKSKEKSERPNLSSPSLIKKMISNSNMKKNILNGVLRSGTKIDSSTKAGGLTWLFPSTGHGKEDGFNDSLLEYFQGDHEWYIAREVIQNAVDARLSYDAPVKVSFEKKTISISEIPGHKTLSDIMKRCFEYYPGQQKEEAFFNNAIELLRKDKIEMLKISDYNTVGLAGSDEDHSGNWYRLVRANGTSSPKGAAGGSFGIGKGAPIAASSLRTVFYSSMDDKGKSVFQGISRLVSHYDDERDVRQGAGFYGVDGYRAIRDKKLIPEIFRRLERGTDIYIIGYKSLGWEERLIRSVLINFWLAILHGDLEISIAGEELVEINKDNLSDIIMKYDVVEAKQYLDAVISSTQQFEQDLKHLGKVHLYVRKEEGYPSKIMMARRPKMLVQERPYRALREPFAGVFLCDNDDGNRLLRELEPPTHDKWDKGRAREIKNGRAALNELETFIKEKLRSMGESINSESQDIPGLDRYLPDSDEEDEDISRNANASEPSVQQAEDETGREVGKQKEPTASEIETILRRSVDVKTPIDGGGLPGGKPNKTSGGNRAGSGGGKEEGDGKGERIRTADIGFRSFVKKAGGELEYCIVLEGREECKGDIKIIAIGDDGEYPIDIKDAFDMDSKQAYEVSGPMIKGLEVESHQKLRLIVKLKSKKKYALGIENYEN